MNLTKVASLTRKTIATVSITLILYSVGYFSLPYLKELYLSIFPPKEKPALIYGLLPKINFKGLIIRSKPEYVLNTKDGRLPNITPELFSVYKVNKPKFSFNAGKDAQNKATLLFFKEDQRISELKGSTYKWVDAEFSRQLESNISINSLEYFVNGPNNKDAYIVGPALITKNNEDLAKQILTSLGYFTDQLYGRGTSSITFGKIVNNRIEETQTPGDYTFAKVDFFRTIYKVPIYGPRFDDGLLEVTTANPVDEKGPLKFQRIKAREWSIDTDTFGRYPPLSILEAWKKVTENQGVFAKLKVKNASVFEPYEAVSLSKVFIEDVSFAYYDSEDFQEFMQPIYAFQGTFTTTNNESGKVVIYIPAISDKYFK